MERVESGRWQPAVRRQTLVLCSLGLSLMAALMAQTAGDADSPRLVMVYGELLAEPVMLADPDENARLMASISTQVDIPPENLSRRQYLNLALFWEGALDTQLEEAPAELASEHASQQGKFFPAAGDRPALIWLEAVPGAPEGLRWVAPEGVALLKEYGVPVRVEDPLVAAVSLTMLIAGLGWLLLLLLVINWLRRSLRQNPPTRP